MKHFLITSFVIFFSITSYAAKWCEGTVVFTNSKSRTGFIKDNLGVQNILFKASEDAKVEQIETSSISEVTLKTKEGTLEYHRRKVYKGWRQKRISSTMWLQVVEKGIATLYVVNTTMSSVDGMNRAGFQDYYCIRAGEPAAKMIANIATFNNNQTFRAKAPLYFDDYPELAAKIKSKEYKWKDLLKVVREYNKWASKKM